MKSLSVLSQPSRAASRGGQSPIELDRENSMVVDVSEKEIHVEAKIQVPTRFKSRTKMMNFGDSNPRVQTEPQEIAVATITLEEVRGKLANKPGVQRLNTQSSQVPFSEISEFVYADTEENPSFREDYRIESYPKSNLGTNDLDAEAAIKSLRTSKRDNSVIFTGQKLNKDALAIVDTTPGDPSKDSTESNTGAKKNLDSISDTLNLSIISSSKASLSPNTSVVYNDGSHQRKMLYNPLDEGKSDAEEVNTMLKEIVKTNGENNMILKNRINTLEDELDAAYKTISKLKKSLLTEKIKKQLQGDLAKVRAKSKPKRAPRNADRIDSLRNRSQEKKLVNFRNEHSFVRPFNLASFSLESTPNALKSSMVSAERAQSIESRYNNDIRKLKLTYEEDIEFQREELTAMYETKIEQILGEQSKQGNIKEILKDVDQVCTPSFNNEGQPEDSKLGKLESVMKENEFLKKENNSLRKLIDELRKGTK